MPGNLPADAHARPQARLLRPFRDWKGQQLHCMTPWVGDGTMRVPPLRKSGQSPSTSLAEIDATGRASVAP